MSVMLLWVASAMAARVYWTALPTDTDAAAVARTVKDARSGKLEDLMTGGAPLPSVDGEALQRLSTEVKAVRPLLSEFDGELQVMSRLSKAAADVHVLRTEEERDILYESLLLAGFAVHRYYQDKVGSDPGAAPYRTGTGDAAEITAWLDAAALYHVSTPMAAGLPEPAQALAYDKVQAMTRSMPVATVVVKNVASGANVRLDGVKLDAQAGTRVTVLPGRHFLSVDVGETALLLSDLRVVSGSDVQVFAPVGPEELATLRGLVDGGKGGWEVPSGVTALAGSLGEPVYVAVPGGRQPKLFRVDGGKAQLVPIAKEENTEHFLVRGTVGGGWSSDGDWYTLNADAGAPYERGTVNAGTLSVAADVGYQAKVFAVGVGVDTLVPFGEWETLPSGDGVVRPWVYPHVNVGIPWAQFTVGPLFPWHVGVGLAAHIPVVGPLEVTGGGVYGVPIGIARSDGPDFEPDDALAAWGGLSYRFGW